MYKEMCASVKYLQCFRIEGSHEGRALLTLKAIYRPLNIHMVL